MKVTISNPPYNMKWDLPLLGRMDERFVSAGIPPKSNANYAFVLSALNISDRCIFLLPNGVLTTSNKAEKQIIQYIVDNNLLSAVILNPNNMFVNTNIPTCILIFDKHKQDDKVVMVDLRQKGTVEIREQRGQFGGTSHTNRIYKKEVNILSDELIDEVIRCVDEKKVCEFSQVVTNDDIKNEEYILSPSRYVEFVYKENEHRAYEDIVRDLNYIIEEKNCCKLTINESLAKSLGFDLELYKTQDMEDLNRLIHVLCGNKLTKENYFQTTKKKNELIFKNNSKDKVSSVLMMILNTWKQHVYYLNTVENQLLVELRDALLPELMSGKIDFKESEE